MAEKYKSSKSVNVGSNAKIGQYNASRNGQRNYTPPQNKQNEMFNKAQKMQQNNNVKNNQDPNNPNELNMQQKIKKQAAKKTLTEAAKAYNPALGAAVEKALDTKKGDEYLNEFAKADSTHEGIKNVEKKAKNETRRTSLILTAAAFLGPLLLVGLVFLILFAKNADSQVYSKENDGQVIVSDLDDETSNVFKKYPKLYEKIETEYKKVADKYEVNIDRFLLISALVAPLENDYITPVEGNCNSETHECYKFKGKLYNWEDFLDVWSEQTGLLAKMQILSYIDTLSSSINVTCGSEETMEQYAKNDLEVGSAKSFWSIFDIFNIFGGYRNEKEAELNAHCTDAPPGKTSVPDVYVLSRRQGKYYTSLNNDKTYNYEKDPNSGGVFFWNLINKDGFINTYFEDYLSHDENKSDDENYKINLPRITEIANYIYSYYNGIRRDCNDFDVIDAKIEKIKVKLKDGSGYEEVDLDQYVGGVIMAEFASGGLEAERAMAILARTEGIAVVGTDGEGIIENSSNAQNYNGKAYNPTYDSSYKDQKDNPNYDPDWPKKNLPIIWQAVQDTKGIVIRYYDSGKIRHTEYDAFCPQNRELDDGFYYLDDGQRDLPVNPGAFKPIYSSSFNIPQKYLDCPCFKNPDSRPPNEEFGGQKVRFSLVQGKAPTETAGTPPQTTLDKCWTDTGLSREKKLQNGLTRKEYAFTYKPSGGHGRGASQLGIKYFESFGYKWDGLLGLFFTNIKYGRLSTSLEDKECPDHLLYDGQCQKHC